MQTARVLAAFRMVPCVELAVEVFPTLADTTRVRIVLALREGELSVNQLAAILDESHAAVSQHLAKMRFGRAVSTPKDGTRIFCRLANEHARLLVLDAIFQVEHALENGVRDTIMRMRWPTRAQPPARARAHQPLGSPRARSRSRSRSIARALERRARRTPRSVRAAHARRARL